MLISAEVAEWILQGVMVGGALAAVAGVALGVDDLRRRRREEREGKAGD